MSAERQTHPYRFDHFRTSLMLEDMRFSKGSLRPGDVMPDHRLTHVDGTEVGLRELAADRPLDDVLRSAGKGAYADVARAAPPMALMGLATHLLNSKRRKQP